MIRKAFSESRAAHPLAFEIDFGDEVDGALLVDADAGTEPGPVNVAGADDRFDGGREKGGIDPSGRVGRHGAAGAARRFTIQICIPPSGWRLSDTSSM